MTNALDVLDQFGNDWRNKIFPGKRLLEMPFEAAKIKYGDWETLEKILPQNSQHCCFPQEGGKQLYTLPQKVQELPRFIWLNLGNGAYAGWMRSRKVEREWRVLRAFLRGERKNGKAEFSALAIGGKSA